MDKSLRGRLYLEISQHPVYKDLIRELQSRRPQIPAWNTKDDNTPAIQKALAQREWHDLMMAIINPQEKSDG